MSEKDEGSMQGQGGEAGDSLLSRLKIIYLQNPRQIRRIGFVILLILIMTWLTSINMCGYLGIGGHLKWREEVLLHDGSKIIVQRWQKRFNVYTLEKSSLIQRQSLSFTHPKTKENIVWKSGPTEGINTINLTLIALHIKDNTSYIITRPYGCFAHNKWGRPNPPYVIFRYEDEKWKRIPLEALPLEFSNNNLIMSIDEIDEKEILRGPNLISAEMVKKRNDRDYRAIYKSIVRSPIPQIGPEGCSKMMYEGRGVWGGGYYDMKSYEACVEQCKILQLDINDCPCSGFFNNKTERGE